MRTTLWTLYVTTSLSRFCTRESVLPNVSQRERVAKCEPKRARRSNSFFLAFLFRGPKREKIIINNKITTSEVVVKE